MMFVLGILLLFVGIMISVAWHELGHYLAARKFGIKVPEFFVGFGKTVWSRKVGETEFGFKAIPLGGYVRMIGMLPPAKGGTLGRSRRTGPFQGLIDDARQQSAMDVMPEDAHRQFYTRAPWKRIIVMAAGPFQNLILAVVLFAIAIMGIGLPMGSSTTISQVSECVLPASAQAANACPAGAPPTPAAAAGFRPGDKIVAFNGTPVTENNWRALQEAIRAATGMVTVTVERDGQRLDLTPTLIRTEARDLDDPNRIVEASFLGVTPVPLFEPQGPGTVVVAVGDVIVRTGQAIINLPERLPNLFGSAFLGAQRDQDGPVGIVGVSRIGGEYLSAGFTTTQEVLFLLNLLALVNISLFLFNMLPLPPLDGGQIFPALWEAIRKRIARVRGKPDPGPVDAAKLLPVAYVVALLFIGWSAILLVADVVNPIQLLG
jgi:membrane-associated protease RseP (regulator of RpoE activity)